MVSRGFKLGIEDPSHIECNAIRTKLSWQVAMNETARRLNVCCLLFLCFFLFFSCVKMPIVLQFSKKHLQKVINVSSRQFKITIKLLLKARPFWWKGNNESRWWKVQGKYCFESVSSSSGEERQIREWGASMCKRRKVYPEMRR